MGAVAVRMCQGAVVTKTLYLELCRHVKRSTISAAAVADDRSSYASVVAAVPFWCDSVFESLTFGTTMYVTH